MLMPAVWGGLVIGILSALPIVGAFNFCCCMWVITGGLLASYILQSNTSTPITAGDGAVVGFLAGLLGACVYAVVSLPLNLILGPVQQRALTQLLESVRDVPPDVRDAFSNIGGTAVTAIGVLLGFVMMAFVGAIFATIGGLLGAVFFRTKAPHPPAQDSGGFV
jgi:membrane associated rhomboid family serine protease